MITHYKHTQLCGQGKNSLSKVENDHGDVWFSIRLNGTDNGKMQYSTVIDFSSENLAHEYFMQHVINKLDGASNVQLHYYKNDEVSDV